MSAGAQLEFTEFVDEVIAWQTRDDLNQFFEDIRVPPATILAYGSVKKGASVTFTVPDFPDFVPNPPYGLFNHDTFNLILDGIPLGEVPTKASFLELKNNFYLLTITLDNLLTKLRDAGVIDEA